MAAAPATEIITPAYAMPSVSTSPTTSATMPSTNNSPQTIARRWCRPSMVMVAANFASSSFSARSISSSRLLFAL